MHQITHVIDSVLQMKGTRHAAVLLTTITVPELSSYF